MEEQLVVLVDPWQDKYDRLLEANEKLQKLNQTLEDKLLKLAEKNHAETSGLSEQIQDLTQRLVDARLYIHQLADENDRYRNDINVVIQLLQCKPSNFISPKIETLPEDLQRKILGIKNGVGSGGARKEKKIIKVQVPTFPPTDIMYAVDKGKGKKNGEKDIVSAAIMAKVLQERENERKENRRNNCHCRYRVALPTVEKSSQTMPSCTISYSEFEFYNSEPDDDEEGVVEEDEDDAESIVMTGTNDDHDMRSHTSPGQVGGRHSHDQFQPPLRRPTSWMSGTGRAMPGGAVPVRTTLTTTFDEIIKTSREEEARLPTPLFDGHFRHRNQSSASSSSRAQHNHGHHPHHHDNQDSSSSSAPNGELFNNHLAHHHHQQLHQHHHHHHSHLSHANGHGDHHNSGSLFINNTTSDNSSIMTAATSNGNVSSSCRDTPPSLQRSSSSSLSSPSSGLPPLSIPTSASITTDLNGDIMSSSHSSSSGNATGSSSSNSSHVMSSACNTPSSCSNASTSGIGGGGSSASGLAGVYSEPLPTSTMNNNCVSRAPVVANTANNITGGACSVSNSSINSNSSSFSSASNSNNTPNNVVTLRKGAPRLSTSHISNVCANGSVTSNVTTTSSSGTATGNGSVLTRSTSWNREQKMEMNGSAGGATAASSSNGSANNSGGLGLMTSLGNHWRSTVLVHNPPRSHSSYEPLSLVSVQGDGTGGQQTTFTATVSPKSAVPGGLTPSSGGAMDSSSSHNDYSVDCNSDSEQPLLQQPQQQPQQQFGQPAAPTYLFHAYHNPQTSSGGAGVTSGGFFGGVTTNVTAGSTTGGYTSSNSISNSNQYYRAQKRTFWARSSSTTSTETEI